MSAFRATAIVAIVISAFAAQLAAEPFIDLDQNWSEKDRGDWYDATQGSRLIPLDWLLALEQPDSTDIFLADEHIAKFRYLPRPGQLPVGFAADDSPDDVSMIKRWKTGQKENERWVGFNCAACHTGEITFKGDRMRVEGGAALADFQGFIETLNHALVQTSKEPKRFERFADRVLAESNDKEADRALLKTALSQLIGWQLKLERMNATNVRYGYGRLDAIGHIYNKVVLVAQNANDKLKPMPSNAPVNYPFLWNVPQQNFVQWNAMAPNNVIVSHTELQGQPVDQSALVRNIGEVIGVFADIKPTADAGGSGYKSSVRVASLISMEQMLTRLRPPAWPAAIFGKPKAEMVTKGKKLFEDKCQSCHAPMDRTDLTKPIAIKPTLLLGIAGKTDPAMTCNAFSRNASAGVLEGTPNRYREGAALGARAQVQDMLTVTALGALAHKQPEFIKSVQLSMAGKQPPPEAVPIGRAGGHGALGTSYGSSRKKLACTRVVQEACPKEALGYKARPLNGIWATAPYLHNGSVPTLYDLLLPPDDRPKSFYVGAREFDPDNVGFVTKRGAENSFLFRTRDACGQTIPGNSNQGHDYGTYDLEEADRQDLLAYLKTL
jgi:mono/diheme cytochrome c family protein